MAFGAKIKLSVDESGSAAFRREIQKYVDTAVGAGGIKLNLKNVNLKVDKQSIKNMVSSIQDKLNNSAGITIKVKNINATAAINKVKADLQAAIDSVTGGNGTGAANGSGNRSPNNQTAGVYDSRIKQVESMAKKVFSSTNGQLAEPELTNMITSYNEIINRIQELRADQSLQTADAISGLQRQAIELQGLTQARNAEAAAETAAAQQTVQLDQKSLNLKAQIQRWIMSNTRAYEIYKDKINGFLTQLNNPNLDPNARKSIEAEFKSISNNIREAGLQGHSFFETLRKGWERFGGWSLVTRSMMAALRTIKQMVTAVKELDAAMTELRKVTDLTEYTYSRFLENAKGISQEISATLTDTVTATADFARLGFNLEDSTSLAKAALVYKNVGDGINDISEASESLISTTKAFEQFGITAQNAMEIVDRFNEVGRILPKGTAMCWA